MKRKQQIIVLIVIAAALFTIPFLLTKGANEKVAIGVNLITGLTSLLTFVIALLLFNKFGIERSLLEKQTKEVFDLLENLNKSIVLINGNKEFLRFNPAKPYNKIYEDYYDRKLVFSVKYIEGLQDIWKFTESVFLPKEIADKLKINQVYMLIDLKNQISDDELKVSAPFKSDEEEKFGQANQTEMTFMDFVTQWNELLEEIKKWIKTNSSVKSELNLE